MRLNRYLSQCGLGSRRGCEEIIREGRVSINGHMITDLATQVNPDDRVVADGKPVKTEAGVVIALHKPRGYICSRSDEKDRMTIYSLLPKPFQSLHHVGRLDKDSEGLLLMTNRGELSHRLIHPSMGAEKEYEVIVDQPMDQATMAKLVKGMLTEEGHAKAERAWLITEYRAHVVLKQGLKRQIRLMFYQLGFEVERLVRTRIGWLELKNLQKGGWKQLTETEVERFFSKEGATGRAPRAEKPRAAGAEKPSRFQDDDGEESFPTRRPRRTSKPEREPRGRGRSERTLPSRDSGEERRPRSGGRGRTTRPDNDEERRPRTGGRGRPSRDDGEERRPRAGSRGRSTRSDSDEERRPRMGGRGRPTRGDDEERRPRTGEARARFGKSESGPRGRSSSGKPSSGRMGSSGRSPRGEGNARSAAKKGPRRRP